MIKDLNRILLIFVLFIIVVITVSFLYLNPTPSDEEIPRGSKRVEINYPERCNKL